MDKQCKSCGDIFYAEVNFCSKCGQKLTMSNLTQDKDSLTRIISFYVVFLVFAFVAYKLYENSDSLSNLGLELAIEGVFAALVLGFCFLDFKSILKVYRIPIINWKILLFSFLFPILSSISVYYSLDYLSQHIFKLDFYNAYFGYIFLDHPVFWSIFFVGILPPIFEELAFRGFLFNELIKITSPKLTIIGTAFIFALVHFSFISMLWIFPFGLVLGYLRFKYKTLWYGMMVHFIHNMLILFLDIYYFNAL